jgi:hypothetical protein
MDLIERKSVKLLSQASRLTAMMISEALCDEPQKELIRRMLAETQMLLGEFSDAYFDESDTGKSG